METNDPEDRHPVGLKSPFLYAPDSPRRNGEVASSLSNQLDPRSLDTDPDAFYRPFADQQTTINTTITTTTLPDIFIEPDNAEMASRRNHGLSNGTSSRTATSNKPSSSLSSPAAIAAAAVGRPGFRSVSGPATSQTPFGQSRSASSVTTRPGLIKERLKQFDQQLNNPDCTVSSSRARTTSSPKKLPSSYNVTSKASSNPSGRRRAQNGTSQRTPLFGEVVDTEAGAQDPGFGISSLSKQRSNLEVSSPKHDATFSRSRSQSDIDASNAAFESYTTSPANSHSRSQSASSIALNHDSSQFSSPSTIRSPPERIASPNQYAPPISRIPIRAQRPSDDSPAIDSSRLASPEHSRSSNRSYGHSPTRRSPSPVTLSSRRYSPKRHVETNHTLTAVIKEPPPKLSPTLRSSRPRQPVSAASTAASRARVTERFTKPLSKDPNANQSKPKNFPIVDVASRRDMVESKLHKVLFNDPNPPTRSDIKPARRKKSMEFADEPREEALPPLHPPPPPPAAGTQPHMANALLSGLSPLIEQSSPDISQVEIEVTTPIDDELSIPIADVNHTNESPATSSPSAAKHGLLKQVMNLRDNSPVSPSTELPDEFMSERGDGDGDGETIQILLGETPKLPAENFADPQPPNLDEPEGLHLDFGYARSSIHPDDSVSVVFRHNWMNELSTGPDLKQHISAQRNFTVDSEARSQINRVLDQYQSGPVTVEMANRFRNQLESLSPDLAHHDAWHSPEATEEFLRSVLGSDDGGSRTPTPTTHSPVNTRPTSKQFNVGDDSPVDEDENYRGTAIIFKTQRSTDAVLPQKDSSIPPIPPPKHRRETTGGMSPLMGQTTIPNQPRRTYSTVTGTTDGLGLAIDVPRANHSPSSPIPPTPNHAPLRPPLSHSRSPSRDKSGAAATLKKKTSWTAAVFSPGLPSSPAPKGRLRREDTDKESRDGGSNRDSKLSKPLMDVTPELSPSRRISTEAPGSETEKLSPAVNILEKQLRERWNIMKELVDTEHSYYHDMTIGVDIFMATAPSVTELTTEDRRLIFGNLEQIRNFASEFLDALKKAVQSVYQIPQENRFHFKRGSAETPRTGESTLSIGTPGSPPSKEDHPNLDLETTVGRAFKEFTEKMSVVYGEWMRNHEAANRRMQSVKDRVQVQMWLQECYENAKDITNAWSLDSLLIKPTQRYMKYPLLLQNLVKCTPSDHPDYESIQKSLETIVESTHRINEDKRKAELVEKAIKLRKDNQSNRLNLAKMLHFRGGKLTKQNNSTSPSKPEDDSYEAIIQKFGGHFFQLQIVMRDFEKYCDDISVFIETFHHYALLLEFNYRFDGYSRFPELESRVHRFSENIQSIQKHALPEHLRAIQKMVIDPIRKLWHLHDNPQHLMAKRKKLLPVYNKYIALKEKRDKAGDKLKQEAEQCSAINDVLKVELPKLYDLTRKLVQACLHNFVDIQSRWEMMWMKKLEPFLDDRDEQLFFLADPFEFYQTVRDGFYNDFDPVQAELTAMALTSRTIVDDVDVNFLVKMPEPTGGFAEDDSSSNKRPSTTSSSRRAPSLTVERPPIPHAARSTPNLAVGTPQPGHRLSDSNTLSPPNLPGLIYGQDSSSSRQRGLNSANSSAGPATPNNAMRPVSPDVSQQYMQSSWAESGDYYTPPVDAFNEEELRRLALGNGAIAGYHSNGANWTRDGNGRFSGIFHSALPADISDDEVALGLNGPPLDDDGDPRVLFVVASLFEFNIDSTRREAGYPYLKYVAGEVFDVLGQRGELWLARNQDDPTKNLGWIWEKHFALLPTEDQLAAWQENAGEQWPEIEGRGYVYLGDNPQPWLNGTPRSS